MKKLFLLTILMIGSLSSYAQEVEQPVSCGERLYQLQLKNEKNQSREDLKKAILVNVNYAHKELGELNISPIGNFNFINLNAKQSIQFGTSYAVNGEENKNMIEKEIFFGEVYTLIDQNNENEVLLTLCLGRKKTADKYITYTNKEMKIPFNTPTTVEIKAGYQVSINLQKTIVKNL